MITIVQVIIAKHQIRQIQEKENQAIGGGLSSSMVSGFSGSEQRSNGASSGVSGMSFGNAKQDQVYRMVSGCEREEGISRYK